MTLKLTTEQLQALEGQSAPVYVDSQGEEPRYVILPQDEYRRLLGEELRREIQRGIDDADRGACEEWDVEAIIAEANRRFAARSQP